MLPLKKIGVLALQGCVGPHRQHIEGLGFGFQEVRAPRDFREIQGLILPGGESTTMLKLIEALSLEEAIRSALQRIPVWGICAGAILMAQKVVSPGQKSFGAIPMEVERNSYGRQLDSFHAKVENYPICFIRAPKILSVGEGVEVLARAEGNPIWVKAGRLMATTFHPELTPLTPSPFHRFFSELSPDP